MYISRLCYDVSVRLSVRLSVTEVHLRIVANIGFKFRSHFTAHCVTAAVLLAVLALGSTKPCRNFQNRFSVLEAVKPVLVRFWHFSCTKAIITPLLALKMHL